MQRTVRTFVAIEISPEVRSRAKKLIDLLQTIDAKVRWVDPAQLHLTLKFLGEIDLLEVPKVCAAVESVAAAFPPFSIRVASAGAFPDLKRPRTVWLGVDDETEELAALHAQLEEALAKLGFRAENRRFRPHLTIGRVRGEGAGISELSRVIEEQRDYPVGVIDVDAVIVFSSEQERGGPVYEPLGTAMLEGR
ncbi:MAG TPA: RNA 2',3'-cyclic phosphodiesterase [Pirellulales bacterium]|jgi:2'-5' RNA ligase